MLFDFAVYQYRRPISLTIIQLTCIMPGYVPERPSRSFLDPRVEFLQANNEGIQCATVHHGLSQLGGMLGHRAQDKRCRLLVKSLQVYNKIKNYKYMYSLSNSFSLNNSKQYMYETVYNAFLNLQVYKILWF